MLIASHSLQDPKPQEKIARWMASLDYAALLGAEGEAVPVVERFDWQGRAIEPGFRRVRVMARQTYVLCQAALAGHKNAAALAERAATALIRHGFGSEQFVCRLSPAGETIDSTPDLYDIAFGLFALAWWYRLSGNRNALTLAERSLVHLGTAMRSPSGLGYVSRLGEPVSLSQNPHMHLFEAAIMLAEFSGGETFVDLADELFELASTKLFDPVTRTLPEMFDDNWRPIGLAAEGGSIRVEPGHHYEWVWLLSRYAALRSAPSALDIADQLHDFAQAHGHDAATGLIVDAVRRDGSVLLPALRLWPNTEYLKAQVAMQERQGLGLDAGIAQNVGRIFQYYLSPSATGPASQLRAGWWIDYLGADAATPKCDHVPASSLYHIAFAFSELLRLAGGSPSQHMAAGELAP